MTEQERFDRCLREVLRWEGGFVDDPRDPGGTTNRGVTLATARAFHLDSDRDGDVDAADVRRLSQADAARVYRQAYWLKAGCGRLEPGLDLLVFDSAVNQGPAFALRLLAQTATLAGRARLERIRALREARYRSLSSFPTFGRGWLRRLEAMAVVARDQVLIRTKTEGP